MQATKSDGRKRALDHFCLSTVDDGFKLNLTDRMLLIGSYVGLKSGEAV